MSPPVCRWMSRAVTKKAKSVDSIRAAVSFRA